jgi:manganese efflux pump family protein
MNPFSILLLGLAMSTDAFAAALGKGAGMSKPTLAEALRIGLVFGVIETITPVVGWLIGSAASRFIEAWDHWVAFGLLAILGGLMIRHALRDEDGTTAAERPASLLSLALTGLATSIDAMAVGVSLAFVDVDIAIVAAVIGGCTFAMVTVGILAGRALRSIVGKRAGIAGGVVLIVVGTMILVEHLAASAA